MIGKTGRVTGRIGPGRVGEVMISIRGGGEAFYAHPHSHDETIEIGSLVVVTDFQPPRTVYVDRLG